MSEAQKCRIKELQGRVDMLVDENKRLRAERKVERTMLRALLAESKRLQAEGVRRRFERQVAVDRARAICRDNDWWSDWPDTLHMADIIEKRIYNMAGFEVSDE